MKLPLVPTATVAEIAAALADRLDERARRVLAAIVSDYIETAEPVGSGAIARLPDLDCSSATVRAVMADLEALGFLEKPHASAGRVPTPLGFRFYVDALVRIRPPNPSEKQLIERRTRAATAMDDVLKEASRLLHSLTRHAGVVVAPRPQGERLARLDLVQLREGRVLAVLVARSGHVQNRLLVQQGSPGQPELDRISTWLNGLVEGLTLAEARARLAAEMVRDRRAIDELRARAMALGAAAVADDEEAQTLLIEGRSSFLEEPAWAADVAKMRALLLALEEKKALVQVLDKVAVAQELTIFIGNDSGIAQPAEVAIVAAPYRVAGDVVGTLGVIGPTRMDYSRVIPLVELTARSVGAALDPG